MSRKAAVPFTIYTTREEAMANPPADPKFKLYQLETQDGAPNAFAYARSKIHAAGQYALLQNTIRCQLANPAERSPGNPMKRAHNAVSKLTDAEKSALLAELMGEAKPHAKNGKKR